VSARVGGRVAITMSMPSSTLPVRNPTRCRRSNEPAPAMAVFILCACSSRNLTVTYERLLAGNELSICGVQW
jgi:hypothetical protein